MLFSSTWPRLFLKEFFIELLLRCTVLTNRLVFIEIMSLCGHQSPPKCVQTGAVTFLPTNTVINCEVPCYSL